MEKREETQGHANVLLAMPYSAPFVDREVAQLVSILRLSSKFGSCLFGIQIHRRWSKLSFSSFKSKVSQGLHDIFFLPRLIYHKFRAEYKMRSLLPSISLKSVEVMTPQMCNFIQ